MNIQIGGGGGLLTAIFVIAKITGYIDWSWWWVFAPIWIPFILILAFFAVVIVLAIVAEAL